jgi:hypothetical protein
MELLKSVQARMKMKPSLQSIAHAYRNYIEGADTMLGYKVALVVIYTDIDVWRFLNECHELIHPIMPKFNSNADVSHLSTHKIRPIQTTAEITAINDFLERRNA